MHKNKTRKKLIDSLEIFHECLCSDLAESGRDRDAMAVYSEVIINEQEPEDYMFVSINKVK